MYQYVGLPTLSMRRLKRTILNAEASAVKPVVRWTFCLMVFSLPFDLPRAGLPLEVTTLTACIFLLATALQPHVCFRRPPKAFWCFVLYLYVYVVSMLWHSVGYSRIDLQREQGKLVFLLLQAMVLCWTGYNVMRDQRTAQAALLTLAASCIILAGIHILGLARTTTEIASNIERLSTFGQNPNSLARHLSFGALTLVGLGYGRSKRALRVPLLIWPFVLLLIMAIESTGARGSVIALAAGLLFFVLGGEQPAARIRNIVIVALALSFAIWMSLRSETMVQRFEKSIDEGSMAQRENLYPTAWKMFLDRPLLGWGPTLNMWELGTRVGEADHPFRDTHNLLLEVLTVTGVIGAIPFFVGVFLCLLAAWNARAGPEGVLPLAAIVAILVANVGANLHYNKLFWLVLTYALASGHRRLHVLKEAQKPAQKPRRAAVV